MKKTFSLITTTINFPKLIIDYAKDAINNNQIIEEIIIVGDLRTPLEVKPFCLNIEKKYKIKCTYLTPKDQDIFLKKYSSIKKFIPWNCIQRRNIGLLKFYENRSDIAVLIDDDNFIRNNNYFKSHEHVGSITKIRVIESKTGYWNVCEMLKDTRDIKFYHRGHPLSKRWLSNEHKKIIKNLEGRVVVNAGLWFDDPDVDALTRLFYPIEVRKVSKFFKDKSSPSFNNYSPFNSQNTAILRELIPAYFLFPYIGRYDDIWASYIIKRIANIKRDYVTYGNPIVIQNRNVHDYLKDFEQEKFGLRFNDCFIDILNSVKLEKKDSYQLAYSNLAYFFKRYNKDFLKKYKFDVNSFDKIVEGMIRWKDCFE